MKKKIIIWAIITAAIFLTTPFIIVYAAEDAQPSGWQTVDGKRYYFRKNGEKVTGTAVIGGKRYSFSSDGVCKGAYTGYTKSGGKRYYYLDGEKQYGWHWLSGGWRYFDETSGAQVTGTAELYGRTCSFSENGVFDGGADTDYYGACRKLEKKLSADDYGGMYYYHDAIVVMTVNEENVLGTVNAVRKSYPLIIMKPCEFSVTELEKARKHLAEHMNDYDINGVSTYTMENCIDVTVESDTIGKEFQDWLDTLENKDIIKVETGVTIMLCDD